MKTPGPFLGRWRLIETEAWMPADLDLVGPAHLTFHADGTGALEMIAVVADLDCRFDGPEVEFSWGGEDEGDAVNGRGRARITEKGALEGKIFFHRGDETGFVARREAPPPKPAGRIKSKKKAMPGSPRPVLVPTRKLSAVILDFAAPMLEPYVPGPTEPELRAALSVAIPLWNALVMASPLWGKPHHLVALRDHIASVPMMGVFADKLSALWQHSFSGDPRVVGDWSLKPDTDGNVSLVCTTMLPKGAVPVMDPRLR